MRYQALPLLCLAPALALASSLALSPLDKPRSAFLEDVLESNSADQKYCKLSGEIQDACCDYATVEQTNNDLFAALHDIVATPYFRYHKVDLFRECPFWQEDGSCMNRACSVETTEEEHIPEAWRAQALGKLKPTEASPTTEPSEDECAISDSDFCVLEDELDSEGVYVDLLENPERFTGYAGQSASRVWKAIYEENCFAPVPYIDPSRSTSEGGTGFAPLNGFGMSSLPSGPGGGGWGDSEKKLIGSLAGPKDGGDEICLEKRVFYRVISGLHASISIHICDDYLDQQTGEWAPNLQCFITRIGQHPERLQNVYFTYVLLLRALSKSGPQLLRTLQDTSSEPATIEKLSTLVDVATGCPSTFDETSMFSGPSAEILKTEFKEHFRNVSRIMDCVGCDKCRLWGKMQVTGLGTALKLLFSYDGESALPLPSSGAVDKDDPSAIVLSRSEVVAFVNTLHRLSESLAAVDKFRLLWAHRNDKRDREKQQRAEERKQETAAKKPVKKEEGSSAAVKSKPSSVKEAASVKESVNAELEERGRVSGAVPIPTPTGNSSRGSWDLRKGVLERLVDFCREGWASCVERTGRYLKTEL
ncbi:hypothetical protein BCR35DRAFT_277447 [Leucosporidium creatinivorum]|uniref:Endoplasmic reticulum Oxidoreductin 1-domain-containing protein n=1 Tax=Leucosporidium creatinivorum TaxID=106004 RepID=A0A1Y2FW45_9BASI|nr:hypothetical protein BCR35DRAFT_277447 [Leucosporidium creatinivorum]